MRETEKGKLVSTSVYTVKGMTCSGCINKVTTAVTAVDGVVDVDVDVSTGEMTVSSENPVEAGLIRDAVHGIGYELAN